MNFFTILSDALITPRLKDADSSGAINLLHVLRNENIAIMGSLEFAGFLEDGQSLRLHSWTALKLQSKELVCSWNRK